MRKKKTLENQIDMFVIFLFWRFEGHFMLAVLKE